MVRPFDLGSREVGTFRALAGIVGGWTENSFGHKISNDFNGFVFEADRTGYGCYQTGFRGNHGEFVGTEGYGIVFIEAAAAGTPSIAGNVGGQPEAVRDGETGFVVDGDYTANIKAAIEELALNPELRERTGEKVFVSE